MADTAISGLVEVTDPFASDVFPIINGGLNRKLKLENIRKVLANATTLAAGLMSAADKVLFDQALIDIAALQAGPTIQTIASAATITINAGTDVVVLTGVTTVTTVNTPNEYKVYLIHYPAGAGLTFLGAVLIAGGTALAFGVQS